MTSADFDGSTPESAGRLLIVDPDPEALDTVSRMACRLGYQATPTLDPIDALYYLMKGGYPTVLAECDLLQMDGFQLARCIRRRHLATRVILMTTDNTLSRAAVMAAAPAVDGLLVKPFTSARLEAQLRPADNRRARRFAGEPPEAVARKHPLQ